MKTELDTETINKILHRLDDLSPILYQQIIGSNYFQDCCGIIIGLLMVITMIVAGISAYRYKYHEVPCMISIVISGLMFIIGPLLLIISISDLIQLVYFPDYYVMRHLL